ncbi:MAG: serine/threonine protein kinase [Thermoanaerobaculia bacterium]|nr:serine/threonine protein kinase [Thermoanaerobaculia bacterium]
MNDLSHASCHECGILLSAEPWAKGLCLRCLAELAEDDSSVDLEDPQALVPAAEETALGSVLGGRYLLRSHLGSGGMGEVWLAFDLRLRVEVALKSLRPEHCADPRALESLRQEARLARKVISPHVCRVFDLQELDGREWVAMEHVDGTSLAQILEDRGPLALEEAGELAAQLLAALEAIHDAGLVHGDVKPENVMVTRAGRVVVLDLGIAVAIETCRATSWNLEAERIRSIVGTPAYMSPEQARGEALDARADVFSAGMVLAEIVASARACSTGDCGPGRAGARAQEPEIGDTRWAQVIAKAVAVDREQRFASAAAFARALEDIGAPTARPAEPLLVAARAKQLQAHGRRPSRTTALCAGSI